MSETPEFSEEDQMKPSFAMNMNLIPKKNSFLHFSPADII